MSVWGSRQGASEQGRPVDVCASQVPGALQGGGLQGQQGLSWEGLQDPSRGGRRKGAWLRMGVGGKSYLGSQTEQGARRGDDRAVR